MKLLKYILTLSILFGGLATSFAQQDDKYLAGAVPEVDNRVVFAEVIHLPGASKSAIFDQAERWIEGRYNSKVSRVVYKDFDSGMLVAFGSDTIVFKSSFISLDQTIMTYQLKVHVKDAECSIEMEKINYAYGESEKFTAEEMISDKNALNKSKTKIVRGLMKWRTKTIDHVDELFNSLTTSLATLAPQKEQVSSVQTQVTTVVTESKQVVKKETSLVSAPVVASSDKNIQLPANTAELIKNSNAAIHLVDGEKQVTVPIQSVELGTMLGKTTVNIVVIEGSEVDLALENSKNFTISLYNKSMGAIFNSADMSISCKIIVSQTINSDSITDVELKEKLGENAQLKLYVGEVINLWTK